MTIMKQLKKVDEKFAFYNKKKSNKLTANVIETFSCFKSFFNPQQYPQTYHSLAYQNLNLVLQVRFRLYLSIVNECGI